MFTSTKKNYSTLKTGFLVNYYCTFVTFLKPWEYKIVFNVFSDSFSQICLKMYKFSKTRSSGALSANE
jgi:hypothetical protein